MECAFLITNNVPQLLPPSVRITKGIEKWRAAPTLQEYFLEGAFRNVHARLRTHAESVAFFGGGAREGATVESHFSTLIAHLRRVINFKYVPPFDTGPSARIGTGFLSNLCSSHL